MMAKKIEPHIIVYKDKSVLYSEDGTNQVFLEGGLSEAAKERYLSIRKALEDGFLENVIVESIKPSVQLKEMTELQDSTLNSLVNEVTSEYGRALVGLTVLQLTLKSINGEQNIRLHKGGSNSNQFSWQEGLSMRVLDKSYITPTLRKYGLLKLNADGFMMTRTLAENYPYTKLYKAKMRGAKKEWLELTDWIESGVIDPLNGLRKFIALLNNKTEEFEQVSGSTLTGLKLFLEKESNYENKVKLIFEYVEKSTYSARLFEVAMHSLFQALGEMKVLEGYLTPLSQMRSANKKHGNIGDVEITSDNQHRSIIEGWDAKYGKTYLRDELEELNDKLFKHSESEIVGFVTDKEPDLKPEITNRIAEISEIHGVQVKVLSISEWIDYQVNTRNVDENELSDRWLVALAESVCQRRRGMAPIDEPTFEWVKELSVELETRLQS